MSEIKTLEDIKKPSSSEGMNENQKNAFWSKVDIKNTTKECWEWLGAKKPRGYGNVAINKKYLLAHRVAFELINGMIPKGLIVCHICDNPSCCNPYHLMLGTPKSNTVDMLIKNRQKKSCRATRGSNNTNAKLTEEDIPVIRRMYREEGFNQYEIADKFNVTQTVISCIILNKTWSHVKS